MGIIGHADTCRRKDGREFCQHLCPVLGYFVGSSHDSGVIPNQFRGADANAGLGGCKGAHMEIEIGGENEFKRSLNRYGRGTLYRGISPIRHSGCAGLLEIFSFGVVAHAAVAHAIANFHRDGASVVSGSSDGLRHQVGNRGWLRYGQRPRSNAGLVRLGCRTARY